MIHHRVAFAGTYREENPIFGDVDGGPRRPTRVSEWFADLVRRAGVPPGHLHDLRDTHATHLIAQGFDVMYESGRLGHSTAAFTLAKYGHYVPSDRGLPPPPPSPPWSTGRLSAPEGPGPPSPGRTGRRTARVWTRRVVTRLGPPGPAQRCEQGFRLGIGGCDNVRRMVALLKK